MHEWLHELAAGKSVSQPFLLGYLEATLGKSNSEIVAHVSEARHGITAILRGKELAQFEAEFAVGKTIGIGSRNTHEECRRILEGLGDVLGRFNEILIERGLLDIKSEPPIEPEDEPVDEATNARENREYYTQENVLFDLEQFSITRRGRPAIRDFIYREMISIGETRVTVRSGDSVTAEEYLQTAKRALGYASKTRIDSIFQILKGIADPESVRPRRRREPEPAPSPNPIDTFDPAMATNAEIAERINDGRLTGFPTDFDATRVPEILKGVTDNKLYDIGVPEATVDAEVVRRLNGGPPPLTAIPVAAIGRTAEILAGVADDKILAVGADEDIKRKEIIRRLNEGDSTLEPAACLPVLGNQVERLKKEVIQKITDPKIFGEHLPSVADKLSQEQIKKISPAVFGDTFPHVIDKVDADYVKKHIADIPDPYRKLLKQKHLEKCDPKQLKLPGLEENEVLREWQRRLPSYSPEDIVRDLDDIPTQARSSIPATKLTTLPEAKLNEREGLDKSAVDEEWKRRIEALDPQEVPAKLATIPEKYRKHLSTQQLTPCTDDQLTLPGLDKESLDKEWERRVKAMDEKEVPGRIGKIPEKHRKHLTKDQLKNVPDTELPRFPGIRQEIRDERNTPGPGPVVPPPVPPHPEPPPVPTPPEPPRPGPAPIVTPPVVPPVPPPAPHPKPHPLGTEPAPEIAPEKADLSRYLEAILQSGEREAFLERLKGPNGRLWIDKKSADGKQIRIWLSLTPEDIQKLENGAFGTEENTNKPLPFRFRVDNLSAGNSWKEKKWTDAKKGEIRANVVTLQTHLRASPPQDIAATASAIAGTLELVGEGKEAFIAHLKDFCAKDGATDDIWTVVRNAYWHADGWKNEADARTELGTLGIPPNTFKPPSYASVKIRVWQKIGEEPRGGEIDGKTAPLFYNGTKFPAAIVEKKAIAEGQHKGMWYHIGTHRVREDHLRISLRQTPALPTGEGLGEGTFELLAWQAQTEEPKEPSPVVTPPTPPPASPKKGPPPKATKGPNIKPASPKIVPRNALNLEQMKSDLGTALQRLRTQPQAKLGKDLILTPDQLQSINRFVVKVLAHLDGVPHIQRITALIEQHQKEKDFQILLASGGGIEEDISIKEPTYIETKKGNYVIKVPSFTYKLWQARRKAKTLQVFIEKLQKDPKENSGRFSRQLTDDIEKILSFLSGPART